ncbi:MAG: FAD-binding oxidoreductase [Holophaga sp.]|nr:FAD-binding oxidoreductase [Holophaga sp.]
MQTLGSDLTRLLGEGAVLTEASDLEKYESGWRYGAGKTRLAVRPSTTAEVATVLALCHERGFRVIPQGANTGLVGASVPDASGDMVVLSLERLNRQIDVDAVDRTVRVQGGVLLSQLNGALAEQGLVFPVDLGADPQIGAMVATNTGGTRLLRYGDVRHNLLGLEVVLADGTVVSGLKCLRKDNTGLDLKQLFTGTTGVFGVVTAATLSVVPLPRQRAVALVGCADGEAALALLQTLENHGLELLSAFEVISAEALRAVFTHQPRLRNPFGKGDIPAYTALVELASTLDERRLNLAELLEDTLAQHVETPAGDGLTDVFLSRSDEAWDIRHHVSESLRSEGRVLGLDLAVPRSRMAAFTQAVRAWVAATYPFMRVCDFGHWGDGGTHLNLVWNPADSSLPPESLIPVVQREIYDRVMHEFDGSYSAEHGVGPHNQGFYNLYTPETTKGLCAVLKQHLDPKNLLGTTRL